MIRIIFMSYQFCRTIPEESRVLWRGFFPPARRAKEQRFKSDGLNAFPMYSAGEAPLYNKCSQPLRR